MSDAASPLGLDDFATLFAPLRDLAGPLVAAVSGGPDSTALMHGLAARASSHGGRQRVLVATVDHGLRPGSRVEAEAVAAAARRAGLAHRILTWDGTKPATRLQEAARNARYGLLLALAREVGAGAVVTAHTLDDQAETVLIRLARGSGLGGLAAMRAVSRRDGVTLIRPFLDVPKSVLVATCRSEGWAFIDDPFNADPRFARVRWRALMPALATEGLDAPRLARLASRLARADEALDAAAMAALNSASETGAPTCLDLRRLAEHPDEIVIRALALALGPDATIRLDRLETCAKALLAALKAERPLRRTLAGRLLFLNRSGTLAISPESARRRGRREPFTVAVAATPGSLGKGEGGA